MAGKPLEQSVLVDWLGQIIVAAAGPRPFLVSTHRVGGERDYRDGTCRLLGLEAARGLPAVHHWQRQVHEDKVGMLTPRQLDPGCPIDRCQDLVFVLKELHEQVPVELDVLDNQDSLHGRASGSDCRTVVKARRTSRNSASRSSPRFSTTASVRRSSRALSSGVSSLAVRTITGMSRRSGSACNCSSTAKPSSPGISKSRKITSGGRSAIACNASRPSLATSIVQDSPSSSWRTISATFGSSSTTSSRPQCPAVRDSAVSRVSRSNGLIR